MLKPIVAATALLAIAGSSYVYAQQGEGGRHDSSDGGPRLEHRHRPSAADLAAFTDARVAALKAGLELTPDQAKSWPPFEQALRDMAQLRIAAMEAREKADAQTPSSPFDRLARRADDMSKRSAALKKVAEAGAPLYRSLNDDQKGRLVRLARMLRPHHHMHAFNERDGGSDGRGWGLGGRRFGQDTGDRDTPDSKL